MARPSASRARAEWIEWIKSYGIGKFFDAFVATAQYAESECVYCGEPIFLDIVEGGGAPDWGTAFDDGKPGLDYGCSDSPDTNDEGQGSHKAKNLLS